MEFVQTVFYGNTLTTWILAATVALVVFAASSFTKRLIRRFGRARAPDRHERR
jgi:hypothetical protein